MELKTKYQYTYFIHPFVIKEEKYDKYLLKLLKDKKCSFKIFQTQKDFDIYSYFLPEIRQYMFPTFGFDKTKIKQFEELDINMKSVILSKYSCNIFEYNIGENVQGKTGDEEGIFFKIQKMEIICFNTGICFLVMKTNIEDSNSFTDVLNFNYKFRDIHSEFLSLSEYENIKIQTNSFNDIQKLSEVVDEIVGKEDSTQYNLDSNRFITYAYTCIDDQNWNDQIEFKNIEDDFLKYANILPGSYNSNFDKENIEQNLTTISKWKYIKCGFTKIGSVLLTTGVENTNYTKLPNSYEKEYLYSYILNLYKKIYLQKINIQLKNNYNVENIRKSFIKFTKELWIKDVTNNDTGAQMNEKWAEVLCIDELYKEIKDKYDVIYKETNIEKTSKITTAIAIILAISLIINIINFFR